MHRTIRRGVVAAGLALALTGVVASEADASYYLTQRQARINVRDAAEYRYAGNGVSVAGTSCRPQYQRQEAGYDYHRWVCTWVGYDEDGADVYGTFRITGHSNGDYGYMALYGGLRWE